MGLRCNIFSDQVMIVSPGPYKLNPGVTSVRRGKICSIHLGPVNPDIRTKTIEMTLITPSGKFLPGEWKYQTSDGLLRLENIDEIVPLTESETQDGTIDMSPIQLTQIVTNFPKQTESI